MRLTEENLKGFGRLISSGAIAANIDEPEFAFSADIAQFTIQGKTTTGILTGKKRPLALEKFERHLRTPEILVALENDSLIAMAKPSETVPEPQHIHLFHVKQGEAFLIVPGTWHWVPFPVDAETCRLLVLFRENTGSEDGGVIEFAEKVHLSA